MFISKRQNLVNTVVIKARNNNDDNDDNSDGCLSNLTQLNSKEDALCLKPGFTISSAFYSLSVECEMDKLMHIKI